MEKRHLSWSEVEGSTYEIGRRVLSSYHIIEDIVAIGRGGYVPGVMLSHALDAPLHAVDVDYYVGTDPVGKPVISDWTSIPRGSTLVIDDVVDTGTTMPLISEAVESVLDDGKDILTASLYVKEGREFEPDYWDHEYNEWLVFPWEVNRV